MERNNLGQFIKGGKRPDIVRRNKSLKQRKAISKAWKDGRIKATYGHKDKKHSEKTKKKLSNYRKNNPIRYWLGKKRIIKSKKWLNNLKKWGKKFRGKGNHNWENGITKLADRIRKHKKYKEWRDKVYKRDKYTCKKCGKVGSRLHADHIKQFALILKENKILTLKQALLCKGLWNISNGRTLCIPCHKQTDTYLKRI